MRIGSSKERHRCVAGVAAVMLLLPACSFAADLLRAEITSLAAQPRAGAPFWVQVKLTSQSTRLREGVLEFTHSVQEQPQWKYSTQELALTGGTQTFRFLLPGSQTRDTDERSLHLRFQENGTVVDLGSFPLTTQWRNAWPLTMAVGPSSARAGGESRPFWVNFRLERLTPPNLPAGEAIFSTAAAVLEPADFPTDPAGYCAFDLVLLEGADFVRLKEKAVEALGQWLAAGGGLLVSTEGVYDSVHAEALRSWSESDPRAARVERGPAGTVSAAGNGFSFARVGYGRLGIIPSRPQSSDEYESEPWQRATAWAWKLRDEQTDSIIRFGSLSYAPTQHAFAYERDRRLAEGVSKLTQKLLPKTVRVMPRGVVIGLLAGFVFMIGPLDWWLLGRLRARRYTWVLFPMVTAGITAATMRLAQHYLGDGSHRGALVITDLGPSGEVVRETELNVILPARRGTLSPRTAPLVVCSHYCRPGKPGRFRGGTRIQWKLPSAICTHEDIGAVEPASDAADPARTWRGPFRGGDGPNFIPN